MVKRLCEAAASPHSFGKFWRPSPQAFLWRPFYFRP